MCNCSNFISKQDIVYVPVFEGLVAYCAFCRKSFTRVDEEIVVLPEWNSGRIDLMADFISPPRWMESIKGSWRASRCGFSDVVMQTHNDGTNMDKRITWESDFVPYPLIYKWQQIPRDIDSIFYWHTHCQESFRITKET
ncbi:MAG: hypothetical protein UT24_C0030G0021 [Candidatus Woesebacteria bacterium GW2011_GWB1_39_12]|uniref:Uncharacterized protein n=1 Tax=Candidatus Woesebacteria bacterium GW2011_GWB1_39_12 TaxID=1618574 RepID=A0A0G0M445_9BACT|nr:MAG: hypothetical protein UT24_C0030G0021 [Candidatus Woesebacteria bacterium GW2011_GWB1_39_12]